MRTSRITHPETASEPWGKKESNLDRSVIRRLGIKKTVKILRKKISHRRRGPSPKDTYKTRASLRGLGYMNILERVGVALPIKLCLKVEAYNLWSKNKVPVFCTIMNYILIFFLWHHCVCFAKSIFTTFTMQRENYLVMWADYLPLVNRPIKWGEEIKVHKSSGSFGSLPSHRCSKTFSYQTSQPTYLTNDCLSF